jgi:hypothetical protein
MKNLFRIIFIIIVIIIFQASYIQYRLNARIDAISSDQIAISNNIYKINLRAGELNLKIKSAVLRRANNIGFSKPLFVLVDKSAPEALIEARRE